jgi:hypothetical protein
LKAERLFMRLGSKIKQWLISSVKVKFLFKQSMSSWEHQ